MIDRVLVQAPRTLHGAVVQFDARDLASGMYYARLQADGRVETRKMVLLK